MADITTAWVAQRVAAFDDSGIHRVGTAGDFASGAWFENETATSGVSVSRMAVPLQHTVVDSAYVECAGLRIDGLPMFDSPPAAAITGGLSMNGGAGAIGYAVNHAVLHTDERLLPPGRAPRAAWNYLIEDCRDPEQAPTLTYLMNRLLRLDAPESYCVTLNAGVRIDPARVLDRMEYEHPQYDFPALRAQERLHEISGADRVWFAGAYHRHGFHEDGLRSGLAVARALGARG